MFQINIPGTIRPNNPDTNQPIVMTDQKTGEQKQLNIEFIDFVGNALLRDAKFYEGYVNLVAREQLIDALKKVMGNVLVLSDEAYMVLRAAALEPTYSVTTQAGQTAVMKGYCGIEPRIMPQLLPFLQAILEAKRAG
jgi:hypothetical protein